ncbi:Penicillin-insensitive transglycosylase / Penicillin-sensitive transpeptidase [Alphaproteobacteria bacterium]
MRKLYLILSLCTLLLLLGAATGTAIFLFFSKDLPDYAQLASYDPPVISRVYTTEGKIMAEYAYERRIFTPFDKIPKIVINAFLAAEDKKFFEHRGIDVYGIIRAALQNIAGLRSNKRAVGGSTITQQVVKDFLLTNEHTFSRKIKEAILAYRISKVYSKERILELYLNQIFLGNGSYGVAAAAQNYFGKALDQLNLAEVAMLAALPKAPSSLNPYLYYEKAKIRRDWVITRMAEEDMITESDAVEHVNQPIVLYKKSSAIPKYREDYYSETVRRELIKLYGEDVVYTKGLIINANIDEVLQEYANTAFRAGLREYDRRHGWRGPLGNIKLSDKNWQKALKMVEIPIEKNDGNELAVVLKNKVKETEIGLVSGKSGLIPFDQLVWARKCLDNQTLGPVVKKTSDVFKEGDIIIVKHLKDKSYGLEQIPDVNGGMVVLQPYTGRVLAVVGGYSNGDFNRATQAQRQPGSAFKTFVYLAALQNGFSGDSVILDEPITISQGQGLPVWAPKNYGSNFLGPITLETAFAKSRNLPTVRLVLSLGLDKIMNVVDKLGVYSDGASAKNLVNYAIALGSHETTLMNITNAYNIITSNGYSTSPKFIDSIYDGSGNLLYSDSSITCANCKAVPSQNDVINENLLPRVSYFKERLINTKNELQIVHLLQEAVKRGTAVRARILGENIAGKTGTTNNSCDTWFIGFSSHFTVGIYVGFDTPRTLGKKETGGTVALPIFVEFMRSALKNFPDRALIQNPTSIDIIDMNTEGQEVTEESSSIIPAGVNSALYSKITSNEEISSTTKIKNKDLEEIINSIKSNTEGEEAMADTEDSGESRILY